MTLGVGKIAKKSGGEDNIIRPGSLVEFEQHGKPVLGIATSENKGKWLIADESGDEIELPTARLYLLPETAPKDLSNEKSRSAFLHDLLIKSAEISEKIDIRSLWSLTRIQSKGASTSELTKLLFKKNDLISHLAVRRALLCDDTFFKRLKTGFEPFPPHVVEQRKKKASARNQRAKLQGELVEAISARLNGQDVAIPDSISLLEKVAALGKHAPESAEVARIVNDIIQRNKLELNGRLDERVYLLLQKIGHFSDDEHLNLIRYDRQEKFTDKLETFAASLSVANVIKERDEYKNSTIVSIDSESTKDIDDALSIETTANGHLVGIHIADVSSVLPAHSDLENEAIRRATTMYFPDGNVPMLPRTLSEGLLSLIAGDKRPCVSFFIEFTPEFEINSREIRLSAITVSKKLSYETANKILYDELKNDAHEEMLIRFWDFAQALEKRRIANGAVNLPKREMKVSLEKNGTLSLNPSQEDTPAHILIGEFMILANETAALYAAEHNIPLVFRTQEEADAEQQRLANNIAEGPAREFYLRGCLKRSESRTKIGFHAGLGLKGYCQATSPIRRTMDLLNHRQIVSHLGSGKPFYQDKEVAELISKVESSIGETNTIQRDRLRYWMIKYLQQENINEFEATVVRNEGAKPLAELDNIKMLLPFHPKKGESSSFSLGQRVRLAIDRLNLRRSFMTLKEV